MLKQEQYDHFRAYISQPFTRREMGIEEFKGHKAHDNPIDRNAKQNDTDYTYSSKGDSKENKNHPKVNYLWIANFTEIGAHDSQDSIPPMMRDFSMPGNSPLFRNSIPKLSFNKFDGEPEMCGLEWDVSSNYSPFANVS